MIALARTSNTMLNRSGESGTFVLFLTLEGNMSSFHHWVWCHLFSCHIWPSLYWGTLLPYPTHWSFLSWKNVVFCQILFLHLLRWLYDFYLSFYYCDVLHLLVCVCWTSFASQEKIPLDSDAWSFQCAVELGLLVFCWEYIYINQGYWPVVFFSYGVPTWLR